MKLCLVSIEIEIYKVGCNFESLKFLMLWISYLNGSSVCNNSKHGKGMKNEHRVPIQLPQCTIYELHDFAFLENLLSVQVV